MAGSRPTTGSTAPIVDPIATKLLTLAIQAENNHRYLTAKNYYTEGIQVLFDSIRGITDPAVKKSLTTKAAGYLERAETLQKLVNDEKRRPQGYHEQISIAEGSVGYSYEKVFLPYLDQELTEVDIDDAYIRAPHQIGLFLRFCGVLVKFAHGLHTIRLKTTRDPKPENRDMQLQRLDEIRVGLLRRKVILFIEYSDTLHDREIRFNNGWLIKIGRGLDFYKRAEGQNTIDVYELDFRQCMATTIDIIYKPATAKR